MAKSAPRICRRESSELRLRVNTIRLKFHEASQLLRGELSVEVDNGSNSDKLNLRYFSSLKRDQPTCFSPALEEKGILTSKDDICNHINALLLRPTSTNTKRSDRGFCANTGPFLRLPLEFLVRFSLSFLIDRHVLP